VSKQRAHAMTVSAGAVVGYLG